MKTKKILAALVVLVALPLLISAQDVDSNSSSCVSITHDLRYRASDSSVGGDVSTLQDFLQTGGYLSQDPTGYFGLVTLKAVKAFQLANGVSPSGFVGSVTRGKLNSLYGCGGNVSTALTPVPTAPISPNVGPVFYKGPFRVTSVTCGDTYTFQVDGYSGSQVWLHQEKLEANGNSWVTSFDGWYTVPTTYTSQCNKDEGTYSNTVYSQKETILGSPVVFSINQKQSQTVTQPVPSTPVIPTYALDTSVVNASSGGIGDGRLMRFTATAPATNYAQTNSFTYSASPVSAAISNIGLYAYTDSGYSNPLSGAGVGSGGQVIGGQSVTIPAGGTIYFELRGSISGITSGSSVTSTVSIGSTTFTLTRMSGITQLVTPTATLSVTPSVVTAGQNITYNWSSTNAASWAWSLSIFTSGGVQVSSDGCGTVAASWTGPSGGNSASGTWNGATSPCMAGYTYYIYYKAINGGQTAQAQQMVVVTVPTTTTQTTTTTTSTATQPVTTQPTTASAVPTVTLSITPAIVAGGQNITYTWSSTNATSWSWSMTILNSLGGIVPTDGCGTVASRWSGPPGGNSASGTWTGATVSCQAGYAYYIYYKATNARETASIYKVVQVSPTVSKSNSGATNIANAFKSWLNQITNTKVKPKKK